ncbi:TadE/TadG family type IV pilus assembly protein [Sphingomonas alpina]|uniref:Pilus assembly protein n=1 Tax=Sphingomonas alpina TaxID=653931 RepID=A0A7H0LNV5_9SPHN|nr:TadE/TadG family type IV pilus assembly protein [Sphingomonas alpina]QNQ11358.1 pilus assembly protein [Sphingomonas alpina]
MSRKAFARIAADRRGVTAIEFAIVAPVMGLLLLGAFDTAHSLYMRAVLQGVVQKVARDGALESGTAEAQQIALDNKVRASVRAIATNATITFSRRFFRSYDAIATPVAEPFTDTNHNGTCDEGEPYQDENGTNTWDADGGGSGQGNAKDRTVYTVSVSYPRFFPLYNLIATTPAARAEASTTRISATTVLENQPFSDQSNYVGIVKYCPL